MTFLEKRLHHRHEKRLTHRAGGEEDTKKFKLAVQVM